MIAEAKALRQRQIDENYDDGTSMDPLIKFMEATEKRLLTQATIDKHAAKKRKKVKDDVVIL